MGGILYQKSFVVEEIEAGQLLYGTGLRSKSGAFFR